MKGNITARGEGRWLVRVFLGRDSRGRQRVHSKVIRGTKGDAEAYAAARVAERSVGRLVERRSLTLGSYLADFLETDAPRRCRANTLQTYVELVDRYVPPRLLRKRLQAVSITDLQGLIDDLVADGLSSSTVRQVAAVLRSALGDATKPKKRLLADNPAAYLELPTIKRRSVVGPSSRNVAALLSAFRGDRKVGLVLETILVLGLRPSEAVALQIGDLDFERGQVLIQRRAVQLRGRAGVDIDDPKSSAGKRVLALPGELQRALKERADQFRRAGPATFLFASSTGRPIHRSVLRRHLKAAALQAGLPPTFRLYDLRHAHATMLSDSGVPTRVAADQLGHANPSLTLSVYEHSTPESGRLVAQTMERIYEKSVLGAEDDDD